jgi:hypothetical protein
LESSFQGLLIGGLNRMKICFKTGIPLEGFGRERKNSTPLDSWRKNSTKSTLTLTEHPPQTSSPWWCRFPLLWSGICGSSRSDAGNLFWRGWPRALTVGLTYHEASN